MADAQAVEAAPSDMQRDGEARITRYVAHCAASIALTLALCFSFARGRPMRTHLLAAALQQLMPSRRRAGSQVLSGLTTWTLMETQLGGTLV